MACLEGVYIYRSCPGRRLGVKVSFQLGWFGGIIAIPFSSREQKIPLALLLHRLDGPMHPVW